MHYNNIFVLCLDSIDVLFGGDDVPQKKYIYRSLVCDSCLFDRCTSGFAFETLAHILNKSAIHFN